MTHDLEISEQSIYTWRHQDRIDHGLVAGLTSAENAGLAAARTRISDLEADLAASRLAVEEVRLRGGPTDGGGASYCLTGLSRARHFRVGLLPPQGSARPRSVRSGGVADRSDPADPSRLAPLLRCDRHR